jgi:ubiquitin C-terminal hydrolase
MNSVLQALTHSSGIANDALRGQHMSSCARKKANLFCGYCQLLTHVMNAYTAKGKSDLAPEAILRQLKLLAKSMRFGRQEDSHEFLRQLIDSCVLGELPIRLTSNPKVPHVPQTFRSTTTISQLFSGYLQSQVTCGDCGNVSRTFDPYMDISLEIQDSHTLVDCLKRFTRPDSLAGQNAYRCSKCHRRVSAKKQMVVHRCPPLLTFQFKRFNVFSSNYRSSVQKINKAVKFGATLDMKPFMSSPSSGSPLNYSLYAVIVHEGSSMGSGHYVCYAKAANGLWYLFNDNYVQQVSEQTVLSQSAYIVMYESTDDRCFYPSAPGSYSSPLKTPAQTEPLVTVSTPTTAGGVTVINHESDNESISLDEGSDEGSETEAEKSLIPTSLILAASTKKRSAMSTYIHNMRRAVVRAPERRMLRMLTVMRLVSRKSRLPTSTTTQAEQSSALVPATAPNNTEKWGSISVKTWDDVEPSSRAFRSIVENQTNIPEPGARSQYDMEYDLGKSMHNPRSNTAAGNGLPTSLKDSFNAIARGEMAPKPRFKGGKGKGKGRRPMFNRR